MAGGWSSGFSSGFGPFVATDFPVSDRDPALMTVLAYSDTQTLLYDYSNSENFYVLVKSIPWSSGWSSGFGPVQFTLYVVSPAFAQQWFGLTQPKTVLSNPFLFNSYKLSTVVQQ